MPVIKTLYYTESNDPPPRPKVGPPREPQWAVRPASAWMTRHGTVVCGTHLLLQPVLRETKRHICSGTYAISLHGSRPSGFPNYFSSLQGLGVKTPAHLPVPWSQKGPLLKSWHIYITFLPRKGTQHMSSRIIIMVVGGGGFP